jgi:lipid-binding SYLF domain-containing protein
MLAASLVFGFGGDAAGRSEEATVRAAQDVLGEFGNMFVEDIPASLMAEAHGVAIIPDCVKIGFVLGGQHGRGVVVTREKDGSWRAPMFVTITGGSIGWQVGAQATDFVLVFKTPRSVDGLMRGKFTLGADAAVAAGPAGRRAEAATDAELRAEIYSYSRTRGLFAGVSLEGCVLQVDHEANAMYYGPAPADGRPPAVPPTALGLVQTVARLTAHQQVAAGVANLGGPSAPPANALPAQGANLDALRDELARANTKLSPLLDQAWKQYLALPAEVYERRHPPADAVGAAMGRFEAVAGNPQYRMLAERAEFQNTRGLLRAYQEALRAGTNGPNLALPPPPGRR